MCRSGLWLAVYLVVGIDAVLACDNAGVSPDHSALGSRITLTCESSADVKQVAVQIIGQQWNVSYPFLYDDGTHGDAVAEDQIYTLEIASPTVAGSYSVTFIRVFSDQTETESTVIPLEIQ